MDNEKISIDTLFHQKLLWIHNYEDKYLNITESYTRSNLELNVLGIQRFNTFFRIILLKYIQN